MLYERTALRLRPGLARRRRDQTIEGVACRDVPFIAQHAISFRARVEEHLVMVTVAVKRIGVTQMGHWAISRDAV